MAKPNSKRPTESKEESNDILYIIAALFLFPIVILIWAWLTGHLKPIP